MTDPAKAAIFVEEVSIHLTAIVDIADKAIAAGEVNSRCAAHVKTKTEEAYLWARRALEKAADP